MRRFFLAALSLAVLSRPSFAELDAEVNQPYHLKVVLHVARHRGLTVDFKHKLARELGNGLKEALGSMAEVEVVDRHPLLKKVEAEGLASLDGWKQVSGDKLHFVLVDYVDGHYVIHTRQYDGSTGMASPVAREERLPDPSGRSWVARTVIRMIDRDFGLVGTVDPNETGPEVHVAIKGSGLLKKAGKQGPLARWLQEGDVFLLSKIFDRGGQAQGLAVEWALLKVLEVPADGTCRCHLYYRYLHPAPLERSPGVRGVRCLKVFTVTAPLRLRLINDETHSPKASQPVVVSGDGFNSNTAENLASDSDGIVQTNETYQNVAFVEIKVGGFRAQVPVAMLGQPVVSCSVKISAQAEKEAGLELQKRLLLGQVRDSLTVANQLFEDLNRLVRDKKHDDALDKARKGLEDLQADLRRLKDGRKEDSLSDGEQRLFQELADRCTELEAFVRNVEDVIKKEKDPAIQEARGMIERARLLEGRAEYDKALALYDEALPKLPEGDAKRDVQRYADNLRKDWALKGEEHKRARDFIYNEWPKLKTARELKDNLKKAKEAFAACKEAGDRLTVGRLYLASSDQFTALENELASLKSQQGEDADRKRKLISDISGELYKFYKEEVGKYWKSAKRTRK